jgi:hypothetical protein
MYLYSYIMFDHLFIEYPLRILYVTFSHSKTTLTTKTEYIRPDK